MIRRGSRAFVGRQVCELAGYYEDDMGTINAAERNGYRNGNMRSQLGS